METCELLCQLKDRNRVKQCEAIVHLAQLGPASLEKTLAAADAEVWRAVKMLVQGMEKETPAVRLATGKVARQLLLASRPDSTKNNSYLHQETMRVRELLLARMAQPDAPAQKSDRELSAFIHEQVQLSPLPAVKVEPKAPPAKDSEAEVVPPLTEIVLPQLPSPLPESFLDALVIPPDVIRKLPLAMANIYRVIPIAFKDDVLTVAMSDPRNLQILDDLRLMLGCQVEGVAAPDEQIERAIQKYYAQKTGETLYEALGAEEEGAMYSAISESAIEPVEKEPPAKEEEKTPDGGVLLDSEVELQDSEVLLVEEDLSETLLDIDDLTFEEDSGTYTLEKSDDDSAQELAPAEPAEKETKDSKKKRKPETKVGKGGKEAPIVEKEEKAGDKHRLLVKPEEMGLTGKLREAMRESEMGVTGMLKDMLERETGLPQKSKMPTPSESKQLPPARGRRKADAHTREEVSPPAEPEATEIGRRPAPRVAKTDKDERVFAESAPIKSLFNLILMQALKDKANAIYLEVLPDRCVLFGRSDKKFIEMLPPPHWLNRALVEYIKKVSGLNPDETHLAQQGSKSLQMAGRTIVCSVTTQPTPHGENCIVRLIPERPQVARTPREKSYFEKILGDEAGTPGPVERLAAQAKWLLQAMQATLGLRFILLANACDILLDTVAGYIRGIFDALKTGKAIRRRLSRRQPQEQITGLAENLAISRLQLSRLFAFSGFRLEEAYARMAPIPAWEERFSPTFALQLALELRAHLDEMKRDLSFLTAQQVRQFVSKSLFGFVTSFIPNPAQLFTPWKDWFIIVFLMRYAREDIEAMYLDVVLGYRRMLDLLQQKYSKELGDDFLAGLPAYQRTLANYEADMAERLGKNSGSGSDVEKVIADNRRALQRLQQMLANPHRLVVPRLWPRHELVAEVAKMESLVSPHPLHELELEHWLSQEVSHALRAKGMRLDAQERTARWHEARAWRQRYHLARRLWAKFV
jgi:type II secretory ATPase GspE/PulE/Tfp pilus assembly ATPase PilB-like protein